MCVCARLHKCGLAYLYVSSWKFCMSRRCCCYRRYRRRGYLRCWCCVCIYAHTRISHPEGLHPSLLLQAPAQVSAILVARTPAQLEGPTTLHAPCGTRVPLVHFAGPSVHLIGPLVPITCTHSKFQSVLLSVRALGFALPRRLQKRCAQEG